MQSLSLTRSEDNLKEPIVHREDHCVRLEQIGYPCRADPPAKATGALSVCDLCLSLPQAVLLLCAVI